MIVNYGRIFGWVKIKEWDSTDLVVWAGRDSFQIWVGEESFLINIIYYKRLNFIVHNERKEKK